jgi:hypothetical protein
MHFFLDEIALCLAARGVEGVVLVRSWWKEWLGEILMGANESLSRRARGAVWSGRSGRSVVVVGGILCKWGLGEEEYEVRCWWFGLGGGCWSQGAG